MEDHIIEIERCVGCGLCTSVFDSEMRINNNGFNRPYIKINYDKAKMKEICPIESSMTCYSKKIWGDYLSIYLGHSNNKTIREKGSSGGMITQISVFLLKNKYVDAIIHVGVEKANPIINTVTVSETIEQVIKNSGSRYAPASPLVNINKYLKENKRYAFVGKPCDIRALRNYSKIINTVNIDEKIPYMISFFCAGTPSYKGTYEVLKRLNVKEEELDSFRYRGNGWPGYVTVTKKNGSCESMTYEESWGGILGRYVQSYCRWCADGTGEFADIACGDGWLLDSKNQPIFEENLGRNVVFTRTQSGQKLIDEMIKEDCIQLNDIESDIEKLKYIQYYQYYRKATMLGKIIALKLMNIKTPNYKLDSMLNWSKEIGIRYNIKTFIGTIIRKIQRKI